MRSVLQTIAAIEHRQSPELPTPAYTPPSPSIIRGVQVGLAVGSMKDHMTDEGWQLFRGLEVAEWVVGWDGCDVATEVLPLMSLRTNGTILLQDKREWEGLTADKSRDPKMVFRNIEAMRERSDIFKLTVLKDAQNGTDYHRKSADEIGCHAWVTYYHSDIVKHLAPYVRKEHLVRTWHSIDKDKVPGPIQGSRYDAAILSGAVSSAYPLRQTLFDACRRGQMKMVDHLNHPGYHRQGCETPEYLRTLAHYKVAICTSSRYGYAVRKIIEATACGCVVITDLPTDDTLPLIDGNLVRVNSYATPAGIDRLVGELVSSWDEARQQVYANDAREYYDYRAAGKRLSADIEALRLRYNERKGG